MIRVSALATYTARLAFRTCQRNMSQVKSHEPLIVIIGATGTGKSALAVEIAARYNGEVINADSLQLYKGLPIITNKISQAEQKGVAHHLLDMIGLEDMPWTVANFVSHALKHIREIRSRGRIPVLVGGTHYYIQSLLFKQSLVTSVEEDEYADFKKHSEILEQPNDVIHEHLRRVDPTMADYWHPNDRRKVQRSLEIFLSTGQKASDIYKAQREQATDSPNERIGDASLKVLDATDDSILIFWTYCPKDILDDRLNQRVEKMIEKGLRNEVDEIDSFLGTEHNLPSTINKGRGIWIAIGYKEFAVCKKVKSEEPLNVDLLRKLEFEAVDQVKAHTRQYAKGQTRWIQRKLVSALSRSGQSERLFLLDTKDLNSFQQEVCQKALDITDRFLANQRLPEPTTVSDLAAQVLSTTEGVYDLARTPDKWFREECALCHVIAVTELNWEQHLRSRRHRAKVKKGSRASPSPRLPRLDD